MDACLMECCERDRRQKKRAAAILKALRAMDSVAARERSGDVLSEATPETVDRAVLCAASRGAIVLAEREPTSIGKAIANVLERSQNVSFIKHHSHAMPGVLMVMGDDGEPLRSRSLKQLELEGDLERAVGVFVRISRSVGGGEDSESESSLPKCGKRGCTRSFAHTHVASTSNVTGYH